MTTVKPTSSAKVSRKRGLTGIVCQFVGLPVVIERRSIHNAFAIDGRHRSRCVACFNDRPAIVRNNGV